MLFKKQFDAYLQYRWRVDAHGRHPLILPFPPQMPLCWQNQSQCCARTHTNQHMCCWVMAFRNPMDRNNPISIRKWQAGEKPETCGNNPYKCSKEWCPIIFLIKSTNSVSTFYQETVMFRCYSISPSVLCLVSVCLYQNNIDMHVSSQILDSYILHQFYWWYSDICLCHCL